MADSTAGKPYADYEWYTDDYGGTLIPDEASFNRYARWASYLIDSLTYGAITDSSMAIDCVKDATCAATERAYNYWTSGVNVEGGKVVASESNDGYSVSYSDTSTSTESLVSDCMALIRIYLQGSGLLFRGVHNPPPKWRWCLW